MKRKITMRLLIAVLVMCAMVSFAAPVLAEDPDYTIGKVDTQAKAQEYIGKLRDTGWNVDGNINIDDSGIQYPGYDCVDLAKKYIRNVSGQTFQGNAYDYADYGKNICPNGWEKRYYPEYTPQPGDIAAWRPWKGIAQEYGHVALVWQVSGGSITVVQQSSFTGKPAKTATYNASNPSCYLVPPFNQEVKPSAPTGLSATGSNNSVVVSWGSVSNATGYSVYRATSSSGTYTYLSSTTSCKYTDNNVEQGKTYYYRVTAKNGKGESDKSSIVSAKVPWNKLTAPRINSFTTCSSYVEITWQPVDYATGYDVYRSTSQSDTYTRICYNTGTCKYTDSNIEQGVTYNYKVKARNGGYVSEMSTNGVSYTVPWYTPAAPKITVTSYDLVSNGYSKITWSSVQYADTYRVYRATSNGTYTKIADTTSLYYRDYSAAAGTTYYYKVRAVNHTVVGGYSNVASGKWMYMPAAPNNLICTNANPMEIYWESVAHATDYYVYRSDSEDGTYTQIGNPTTSYFKDTTVEQNKTYYYKVRSMNEGIVGYISSSVSGTVPWIKPAAPKISVSNTDDGMIKLNWASVQYADSYQVYRASVKTGKYTKVAEIKGLEFMDTGVAAGKTCYYKVCGINDNKAGSFSTIVSGKRLNKPAAPSVRTAVSGSSIKVSWGSVKYATTYLVYRADAKDGSYSQIGSTKNRYYNDSTAAAGKTYYYKVRSMNGVCEGALSKSVSGKIPLKAPAIRATVSGDAIKISWKAVKFADCYEVYRATSKTGTYKKIGSPKTLYYTDTTAEIGVTYYYKVLSKNGSIKGSNSNIVSAKVPLPKPAAPVISVASSGNGVTVSYGAVKHAKTYLIYRSTSKSGAYKKIGSTSELSYTDTAVSVNKTYYYKVRAQNAAGTSGYSSVKSVKYDPAALPTVKVGDTIKFGHYEQDNNTANGKEAIEWQVLDVQGGRALLISKYALDCKPYNEMYVAITWEKCTLRSWLNGSFKNAAFTAEELAKIPTVTVPAHNNPSYSTNPGNDTQDQIFLLSITEAKQYFKNKDARIAAPTAYAKAQGVWTSSYTTCYWWLRSPGDHSRSAARVRGDGVYSGGRGGGVHYDGDFVGSSDNAVRPALWVNLGS